MKAALVPWFPRLAVALVGGTSQHIGKAPLAEFTSSRLASARGAIALARKAPLLAHPPGVLRQEALLLAITGETERGARPLRLVRSQRASLDERILFDFEVDFAFAIFTQQDERRAASPVKLDPIVVLNLRQNLWQLSETFSPHLIGVRLLFFWRDLKREDLRVELFQKGADGKCCCLTVRLTLHGVCGARLRTPSKLIFYLVNIN